jgi:hypothetical protein
VLSDVVTRPLGNPESPITDADLVAKFVDCVRHGDPAVDRAEAEGLAESLLAFRSARSVRSVFDEGLGTAAGAREEEETWTTPSR